jgi:hypothetical protein
MWSICLTRPRSRRSLSAQRDETQGSAAECEAGHAGTRGFSVALRRMTEDETVKIRARLSRSGKGVLLQDQATELRELYTELQDVSTAAVVVTLGDAGTVPTGFALERFLELHARGSAIIARASEILGR